jgi:hypothetical protein
MKTVVFRCYPWDLCDEKPSEAIDRLAGEIGVDAISVVAACPGVVQFRPRDGLTARLFATEAAVHFQPDSVRYTATRLRPPTSSWIKGRNPLEQIARRCEQRGVRLRAALDCSRSETLVSRHPAAVCKNVFGDPSASRMCPSNPDVREYTAALCDDLSTNYPLAALELEPPVASAAADHFTDIGLSIGPVERLLLSLCFCESCAQRAIERGLDPTAAQRSASVHLQPTLEGRPARDQTLDAFFAADEVLAAYALLRRESFTRLLETVRRRTSTPLVLRLRDHSEEPRASASAARNAFDLDPTASVAFVDALQWTVWQTPVEERGQVAAELSRDAGGPALVEMAFRCYPPYVTDGPSLVREVHDAARRGHETICFENFGTAPPACLDWVRQSIRYARREAAAR